MIPRSFAEPILPPQGLYSTKTPANEISVRESNTELQISVGQSIFVFGKAKGTLDKVKVGMNVLPFSQVTSAAGNQSPTFNKVTWKRLKNGSIQIQSSYYPWPGTLTWTVFANGDLKMETASQSVDSSLNGWVGLGFNYPDLLLSKISWVNDKNTSIPSKNSWQNNSFSPMADPESEMDKDGQGFLQPFHRVSLEFEEVTLSIRTETAGLHLGFGEFENHAQLFPQISADLAFLLPNSSLGSDRISQSPSEVSDEALTISLNPLVLWFHFQ